MPHLSAMSAPVTNATDDLGLDRPRSPAPRRYYAVRTGRYSVGTSPKIKFRSAIFLHWEDARQFVATLGGAEGVIDENDKTEYASFQTPQEAVAYLEEGECGDSSAGAKDVAGAGVAGAAPPAAPLREDERAPAPAHAGAKDPTTAAKRRKREPACETPNKKSRISSASKLSAIAATPDNNNNSKVKAHAKGKSSAATPDNNNNSKVKAHTKGKSSDAPANDSIDDLHAWNVMFERLADHRKEKGTLDLKRGEDPNDLIVWTRRQKSMLLQRFQGKPSGLTNDQARRLQSLGYGQARPGILRVTGIIDVKSAEEKWNGMLERLKGYKNKNGGSMSFPCDPSSMTPEEREVKNWATEQRREYKRLRKGEESNLTAQRMQLLNMLGFDLSPCSEQVPWETRMEQLRSFVAEHSHCHIPKGHPLFNFVSGMRTRYKEKAEGKKNALSDERVVCLGMNHFDSYYTPADASHIIIAT